MAERVPHPIGAPAPRVDGADKVTGRATFVDDLTFPGMVHAELVTAPHPHGTVESLDVSHALKTEGVLDIVTWRDVPGENQIGVVIPDQPLFVQDRFRFMGDRLCMVVAETRDAARAGAKAVTATTRELPVVSCPVEALRPSSPLVHDGGNLIEHKRIRKGDAKQALDGAHVTVEEIYHINYQEHAYLEPQGVVAIPRDDGGVTIYGTMQCPFYVQKAVARVMGLPYAAVRVIQTTTGGAFGGKEDYPNEPASCAAVAARKLGRPVKIIFSRSADITRSTKRHKMAIRYRSGADAEGRLVGAHLELFVDAGGYVGLSTVVSERANCSGLGPYLCDNVQVDTYISYTNNLFGGAYRGFGAPQVSFAGEAQMDLLAEKLGMDPLEIRRKNIMSSGQTTMTGQPLDESVACAETLEEAVRASDYDAKRAEYAAFNAAHPYLKRGIGISSILYGVALAAGGQAFDGSGALVQLLADGSCAVAIGGTDMGQGANTMAAQIASATLGVPMDRIRISTVDTSLVPDSGPTVASRTTLMSGNAVVDATRQLRSRVWPVAAEVLGVPVEELSFDDGVVRGGDKTLTWKELGWECYRRKVHLAASGWYAPPPKPFDIETGQGTAYLTYAAATQIAEVEVDTRSGMVEVLKVTAAHDVGQAINGQQIIGQIEGGVVQGLGWALMENLRMKDGVPMSPNFTDYLIPTILDAPPIESILVEKPFEDGPYGAKGIGEPSLIPIAAALGNAISQATGRRMVQVPMTPERVAGFDGPEFDTIPDDVPRH